MTNVNETGSEREGNAQQAITFTTTALFQPHTTKKNNTQTNRIKTTQTVCVNSFSLYRSYCARCLCTFAAFNMPWRYFSGGNGTKCLFTAWTLCLLHFVERKFRSAMHLCLSFPSILHRHISSFSYHLFVSACKVTLYELNYTFISPFTRVNVCMFLFSFGTAVKAKRY